MREFFFSCLRVSLWGSGAALVAWGFSLVLRRLRLSSRYLCWLWLVVAARFVLPGGIPLPALPAKAAAQPLPAAEAVFPSPIPAPVPAAVQSPAITDAVPAALRFSLWGGLLCLWGLGFLVLAVRAVVGYVRLQRSVALACRASDGCFGGVPMPFTLGFLRPRIYLPDDLTGAARAAILRHEQTHIRRRDTLTKPLYYFIACLHWWNPLAWLAFHQFERCMEEACDEAAMATESTANRAFYCESILQFSTSGAPVPGSLSFGQGSVKQRIAHLLHYRSINRATLCICLCLVLLGCTACMLQPTAREVSPAPIAAEFDNQTPAPQESSAPVESSAPMLPQNEASAPTASPVEDIEAVSPDESAASPQQDQNTSLSQTEAPASTEIPASPAPESTAAPASAQAEIVSEEASADSASFPTEQPNGDCPLIFPVEYTEDISLPFGEDGHRGTDFAAPAGTSVFAAADGVVVVSEYHYSYGNYIIIDHTDPVDGKSARTLYAHLQTSDVKPGQKVKQWQKIGTVGKTGTTTGNALHLELRLDDRVTDPVPYISTAIVVN